MSAAPYRRSPTTCRQPKCGSFEQSGNKLVAVNINDDPQWIDIDAGSHFAALAGSPPRAGHVRQMGDFLFLSRLDNGGPSAQ